MLFKNNILFRISGIVIQMILLVIFFNAVCMLQYIYTVWDLLYCQSIIYLFIVISQDTVQTQCEDTSSFMSGHILCSCVTDIQNGRFRGNPSCWMWFMFFSSFTSGLNFMRSQQGSSLCVSEILNTSLIFFHLIRGNLQEICSGLPEASCLSGHLFSC